MAVGYSWTVQQGGTDENVIWDIHAKYQSTPLQSSSLIRLHKALEERKFISGSKSAWKKAKTGLVHVTGKSCAPRNPRFLQASPQKQELGLGPGSLSSRQHVVEAA